MSRRLVPRPRAVAPAAVALALAGGVAGCGGSDALAPAEYRARADRLCGEVEGRLDRLGAPSSRAGLADFLQRGMDISRQGNERFGALRPPDGLRRDHDAVVRLQADQVRGLQRVVADIRAARDDAAARTAVMRAEPALSRQAADLKRRYRALGLRRCGTR